MHRYTNFLVLAVASVAFSTAAAQAGGNSIVKQLNNNTPPATERTMSTPTITPSGNNGSVTPAGGVWHEVAVENPNQVKVGGYLPMPKDNPSGSPAAGAGGQTLHAAFKLACVVGGTPAEFPNDVWLGNQGQEALPKGTKIKFEVPSTGYKSAFMLATAVPAGMQVKVADVIAGGAEAGAACTAKLL